MTKPETLEEFILRAADSAGIVEFHVSFGGIVGGMPLIHVSPQCHDDGQRERCVTHDISTTSFRVAGMVLWAANTDGSNR